MNLDKELYKVHNEINQINEGLVFFKDSKKIRKHIQKIKRKDASGELEELVSELEQHAKNFEQAERLYSSGRREEAISLHKELKQNNLDLIKTLNKESIKNALIKIGIATFVLNTVLTMFTGVGLFSRVFSFLNVGQAAGVTAAGSPMQGAQAAAPAVATGTSVAIGSSDMAALSQEREELAVRAREMRDTLGKKENRIQSITQYENSLKEIEDQRRRAERVSERAQRAAERAQRAAERRIERAQRTAERLAGSL